mgnify:CR=1 FL=1
MQEGWNNVKRILKKAGKRFLIILLPLILIVVILASAVYFITIDDGTYKDNDWSSTNYGASQFINDITISDNKIANNTSVQEIWDKMIKSGCRVDKYLSTPEELAKLMMAEIVTKFPDIRANPDAPIDWSSVDWSKIVNNEAELQGIIKFKRSDENNKVTTMKYASEEEFYGYIEEYNSSGSEKAKNNALTHFTLKKVTSSSDLSGSSSGINYTGPYLCWPVDSTNITSHYGGRNAPTAGASTQHKGTDIGAPEGADVYAAETGKVVRVEYNSARGNYIDVDHGNGYKTRYQHLSATKVNVGDMVKKGQVIGAVGSTGISTGPHLHFEVLYNDENLGPEDFKYQNGMGDGTGGFGSAYDTENTSNTATSNSTTQTGKKNNTSTTTKKTGTASVKQVEGDGYSQEYTSSAGITYKEYRQNSGSYQEHSYWSGNIRSDGCGPTALSIIASGLTNEEYTPKNIADMMTNKYSYNMYTSYDRLKEIAEDIGLKAETIEAPTKEQVENSLKNGKVIIMSTHNRLFTSGNHFIALLDIDTEGNVYVSNPNKNTTTGWQSLDSVMSGRDNIVVIDAGKPSVANNASTSKTSTYVAMVATWSDSKTILQTNDSKVTSDYSLGKNGGVISTSYHMSATPVDYQAMTNQYSMPFDLLWAFLVVRENKNFAFDIADLMYNSDFQITIYDNLKTDTQVDTWDYTLTRKAEVNARARSTYSIYKSENDSTNLNSGTGVAEGYHVHDPYKDNEKYQTIKTVIDRTNTVNCILTRANTWVVDYKNEYTYVEPKTTSQLPETNTIKDEEWGDPVSTDTSGFSCEPCDEIQALKQEAASKAKANVNTSNSTSSGISGGTPVGIASTPSVEYTSVKVYQRYINITDTYNRTIEDKKYIAGTPQTYEKTDPKAAEPNFVTIFLKPKYSANKNNIISAVSWLFEIIETNESTANLLDLVKYILQKATGSNFGIKDDFITIWNNTKKITVVNADGDIPVHTPVTTKEQFIQAMSEFAASGKMGETQQAAFEKHFLSRSAEIYDLGLKYNINPELVVVIARHEQSFQDVTRDHSESNFWGLAVYNGMNVAGSYGNFEGGVKAFAKAWASYDVGGSLQDLVLERYNQFNAVNPAAAGLPGTFKGGLSVYTWGGKSSMAENAQVHLEGWQSRINSWTEIFGTYGSLSSTSNSVATKNSTKTST